MKSECQHGDRCGSWCDPITKLSLAALVTEVSLAQVNLKKKNT